MGGLKKIIIATGGVAFSSEYQAILDRATVLGYTKPSAAQQVKQNQLLVELKAAGIWTLLDVFYVFATDGDSDFATLNWKSPANFKITKFNTPTFTTNVGFRGNASNMYLNTGWDPTNNGVNFTQNNCSAGGYISAGTAAQTVSDFGWSNIGGANGVVFQVQRATNQQLYNLNMAGFITGTNAVGVTGFWHLKRTASNAMALFRNGSSFDSDTNASTGLSFNDAVILAVNTNGTISGYSDREFGCWWAGASLNTLESTFNTTWNNYYTSL